MASFTAERIRITQEGRINAPVDRVFPLACPDEEYKWIDEWTCDLVYSESGKVEDGCIFTEKRSVPMLHDSDDGATTWYTVLHDPDGFRVHFVLVRNDNHQVPDRNGRSGGRHDRPQARPHAHGAQ
ncbi:MAG: hypothetical protein ACE5FL_01495 [Myxococcota bacterium]